MSGAAKPRRRQNAGPVHARSFVPLRAAALRALLNVRRRNPHLRIVRPSKVVLRVLELTDTVDYLIDRASPA